MEQGKRELTVQEAIDELLVEIGVYLLTSSLRKQIAVSIASDGHTADDVRMLWEYVRGSERSPERARMCLASVIKEQERRKDAIENVKKHAQHIRWTEPGAKIRHDNMLRLQQLDKEWRDYVALKEAAK